MITIGTTIFNHDQIVDAVAKSFNYKEVFVELGINFNNGRYLKLRKYLETSEVSISHFNRSIPRNRSEEEIETIRQAVQISNSMRETLIRLGVQPLGGNYKVLERNIQKYNIDISHFKGKSANSGREFTHLQKQVEEYLVEDGPVIPTSKLKEKLIKVGIFERKCYNCELTEWLGVPIPLELEHINGNTKNNKRENLTLLCPNCHALTPTYRRSKASLVK